MQPRLARYAISATAFGALTLSASAQWSDDFEAYATGAILEGQAANGWDNWGGTPQPYSTIVGTATVPSSGTGTQAAEVVGSLAAACGSCSDTINYLGTGTMNTSPITAGAWVFSFDVYVPSSFNERSYYIMLSEFVQTPLAANWNVQMYFDGPTASVDADQPGTCVVPSAGCEGAQSMIYDQWVPCRAEFDLNASPGTTNSCTLYYNDVALYSYGWAEGVFGANGNAQTPSLRALDLFPENDNATAIYYDNMDLSPGVSGGPIGSSYCAATNNSSGLPAQIQGNGDIVAANNVCNLRAFDLPANQFGIFIWSPNQGFIPNPGGSAGNLCLAAPIGRFNIQAGYSVLNSGATGEFMETIDLTTAPTPTGPTMIMGGTTANFQAWFRDVVGGSATSNFTNGLSVSFL